MPNKKYVKVDSNKVADYLQKHIKEGDHVIVVDGSYMFAPERKAKVYGTYFSNHSNYELLKVIKINVSGLKTASQDEVLSYQNNCIIQSYTGEIFYCSIINIRRYEKL